MSRAVRRGRRDRRPSGTGRLTDAPDRLGRRRLHPRRRRRRADVRAGHGDPAQRHDRREISRWTAAMIAHRRADGLLRARPARPPTSTPPAGSATRSRCRSPRSWRPAASPCRSCPAAGSGTPAARSTSSSRSRAGGRRCPTRRCSRSSRDVGAVDLRGRRRARARRPQAVRAARRHRHRRGDPADRQLDHEQEDRRGHRRAGARRQGRLRRVHEGRRPRPRAGPDDGRARRRPPGSAPSRCSPTWTPRSA